MLDRREPHRTDRQGGGNGQGNIQETARQSVHRIFCTKYSGGRTAVSRDTIDGMTRRSFLPAVAGSALAASAANAAAQTASKGRLKQGVCRGVFGKGMSMPQMCELAAKLGFKGFDLIGPQDWPALKAARADSHHGAERIRRSATASIEKRITPASTRAFARASTSPPPRARPT